MESSNNGRHGYKWKKGKYMIKKIKKADNSFNTDKMINIWPD